MNGNVENKEETQAKDEVLPGSPRIQKIEEGNMLEPAVGRKRAIERVSSMERSNRKTESDGLHTERVLRPRPKSKGKIVNGMFQRVNSEVKATGKGCPDGKRAVATSNRGRVDVSRRRGMKNVAAPSRSGKMEKDNPGKRTKKQLVRLKIIDMLLAAGWKIKYRPRNGREYQDAIYVSPKGSGYWSVTLAYKVLRNEYEKSAGKSGECNNGFTFVPLAEEEFEFLRRFTKKRIEREGKAKRNCSDGKIKKKTTEKMATEKKLIAFKRQDRKPFERKLKGHSVLPNTEKALVISRSALPTEPRSFLKTKDRNRSTLRVRNSKNEVYSGIGDYVPYRGKRSVLAWMIGLNVVPLNWKVQYVNPKTAEVLLEGIVVEDGVHCKCCNEVVGISGFVTHAGGELSQATQNMLLENGKSLLRCQLDSWNIQKDSVHKRFDLIKVNIDDPNDDTCGACGDGGDLICCDSCPSTFHQQCIDLQILPSDDWHCMYCSCKFCCYFDMKGTGEGERHDGVSMSELLTCHMCEEKYHRPCMHAEDVAWDNSRELPFCGWSCKEIYERLMLLLGVKHDIGEGFSWTFVRRCDVTSYVPLDDISLEIECNSKLAVALSVMDECFLPIFDERTGSNIIQNIVYNCSSNFNRLNYSSFLTAVLEKDDEIISVASVRIHGKKLAEMPFIGTRNMYRRQGMCRRLLAGIESALSSLDVEKLIIPAISELLDTWTSAFGFRPPTPSTKLEIKRMNMLVFAGTDMLQKIVARDYYPFPKSATSHAKETIYPASPLPDKSTGLICRVPRKDEFALNVQDAASSSVTGGCRGSGLTSGYCDGENSAASGSPIYKNAHADPENLSSDATDSRHLSSAAEIGSCSPLALCSSSSQPNRKDTHRTGPSPTAHSESVVSDTCNPPHDNGADGLTRKFCILFQRRTKNTSSPLLS